MSFVEQEDILNMFEGMIKSIFKDVKGLDYTEKVERTSWEDAMWNYGNDKPDIRFEMKVANLKFPSYAFPNKQNAFESLSMEEGLGEVGIQVFDSAETVVTIAVLGCSEYTRKQTD